MRQTASTDRSTTARVDQNPRKFGPIVLACDANYAMQLATVLRSLVEHNRRAWPLDVHVFWEGPESTSKRVFESLPAGSATIRWLPIDLDEFSGLSTPPGVSPMTFARILIPRVIPESVDRVLYLDADMLVLDDLTPIWETHLEGAVAGAVPDVALHRVLGNPDFALDDPAASDDPAVVGLTNFWREALPRVPRVADYFNAGMLLIDLPQWRAERVSERAFEYLARHPKSPFSDQDALNFACDGRWKRLPMRWNHQDHLLVRIASLPPTERPGIVHFATSSKPWKAEAASRNARLWDAYRRRTLFARSPAERLSDAVRGTWFRSKRALLRIGLVRSSWQSLKRRWA